MSQTTAIEIPPELLTSPESPFPTGHEALQALLDQAAAYIRNLRERSHEVGGALLGRVRGTGPGVSFGAFVDAVRSEFDVRLISPFEGSHAVAGGVLLPERAGIPDREDGFLFLRFDAAAKDLPIHTHDHSERLIYVLDGRGTFHVSSDAPTGPADPRIRHIPIRSRDVLMFRRGTMHTFSTAREPLLLLSYHAPFISLDDSRQYTVPANIVMPADGADVTRSRVSCDPAWTRLI